MAKKIATVSCGVLLAIVIAFARAGAFPLWNSSSPRPSNQNRSPSAERTAQAAKNPLPAPAN
jgi:hypothetical protein